MLFQKVIVIGTKEGKEKEAGHESGKVSKDLVFLVFLFISFCFVIHVIKLEPYPKSYE